MSDDTHVIYKQVQKHEYQIDTLVRSVDSLLVSLDKNTISQNELNTKLAIYMSKHDNITKQLSIVESKIDLHSKAIASMTPVVEGVRGLVWKMLAVSLSSGGLVSVAITLIDKG